MHSQHEVSLPPMRRRRDGLYEVKVVGADGRRHSVYGRTPEEAKQRAVQPEGTLQGYMEFVYLPTKILKAPRTKEQIAWSFDKYILPAFGHRPLDSITRREVQGFVNGLRLKAASVKAVYRWFAELMRHAEDDELIARTPCRNIRLPENVTPITAHLSASELRILRDGTEGDLRRFVVLAGYLGLRKGEALGMTRVKNGVLRVERQVTPHGVSERLKTRGSYRAIPLPPEIEAALDTGNVAMVDMPHGSVSYHLGLALERLGLPRITPHGLRHTFASIMEADLGAPEPVVRRIMGHAGRDVHSGYTHASDASVREWLSRLWTYTDSVVNAVVKEV